MIVLRLITAVHHIQNGGMRPANVASIALACSLGSDQGFLDWGGGG